MFSYDLPATGRSRDSHPLERALAGRTIEYDEEKENVSASFQKLFKDVQEKKSLLDAAEADLSQAQKTFDIQTTKYQCGMISQITYNAARDTYTNAKDTVQKAEIDLFTAYNTYVWAKRGVMMST